MLKKLIALLVLTFVSVIAAGVAYAAGLSVRTQEPKSPQGHTSFALTFVALDVNNNPITVKCYKKGPGEGSFSQYDSDKNLSNGGNTSTCNVNTSNGTTELYVTANNGSETVQSNTVSVEVKTDGPGTPTNYNKEKTDSCTYKISFRTADDSNKTAYVEIYRSDSKSFGVNNDTKVGTVNAGSNSDQTFSNNVPDCNKTYYFAVRAFDNAGNGSGVAGDSEANITTTTVANNQTVTSGAIPVSGGNVLSGETTASPTQGENVSPTGSEEVSPTEENTKAVEGAAVSPMTSRNIAIGIGILVIGGLIVYYFFSKARRS